MKKQTMADLSLLLVAFVWGVGFLLVQNAIDTLEPFTYNGIRFLIAAVFIWVWLFVFKKGLVKMIDKSVILAGVVLGIWLHSAYAFQTFGLLYTASSKAGFITGLNVVLVPILALFVLKEKPKPASVAGVSIATAGLYLLTMADSLNMNLGDLLVLFCAFAFAFHIILTDRYTNLYSALVLTGIQLSTVAGLSIGSALIWEDWQRAFVPAYVFKPEVIISLLVTSVFATALAFLAQTAFQKYTSPTRVAIIYTMEPVFAAIAGVAWAGEDLTSTAWIGSALILAGMLLSELSGYIQFYVSRLKKYVNDM